MDQKNFQLAQQLVNPSYIRLAQNSINKREKIVKELLSQRQLPSQPLDDLTIRYILDTFALMDSNNFDNKVGVGERESRIFSRIVAERNFNMGHGIGRSGDIMANQPKAAGSTLILQLTRYLIVSALHQLNYEFVKDVLPLPLATGMSLSLALLTLAQIRPERKYIIWSRIDQKTCLKAVQTANLQAIVVQLRLEGDGLCTDLQKIQAKINQIGCQKILCIMSTTSCFAPRVPDKVDQLALIAKKYGIYQIVNNAYGIWCSKIANSIKEAQRLGQCTVVVQSTDKNFLVPVGGSFIFCKDQAILDKISSKYPGRACGSPILDMFITLLSMGKKTIAELKTKRKNNFKELQNIAKQFATKHNCQVLQTPMNSISIGMNLGKIQDENYLTQLGSILYSKRVMGHRIVVRSQKLTKIAEKSFINYGSHNDNYPLLPYMTFACAVGTEKQEITIFFERLEQSWLQLKKKQLKKQNITTIKTSTTSSPVKCQQVNQESKTQNQYIICSKKLQIQSKQIIKQQNKKQIQKESMGYKSQNVQSSNKIQQTLSIIQQNELHQKLL